MSRETDFFITIKTIPEYVPPAPCHPPAGRGEIQLHGSADHKQDWQPCRLMPTLLNDMTIQDVLRVCTVVCTYCNTVDARAGADDGGLRRSLRRIWSDHLREQDRDHVHADSARTGNEDSLQRHGATVPPDNLLHLPGRHID